LHEFLIHLDGEGRIVSGEGSYLFDWRNGAFFSNPGARAAGEVFPVLTGGYSDMKKSGQALSKAPPCT